MRPSPITKIIVLTVCLGGVPALARAQELAGPDTSWDEATYEGLIWGILALEGLLILAIATLYVVIKVVADKVLPPPPTLIKVSDEARQQAVVLPAQSLFQRIMHRLTDAVPVEREEEVMTHHEYDGIYELDNNLPPWWKAMFYLTIAFGVVYLLHFHIFDTGDLQGAEYQQEVAAAQAQVEAYLASQANNIDETNVTQLTDDQRLAGGQVLFEQKCAPCHGASGEGGVGPNLTDQYWIHGGDVKDIFRTIKYGVPAKGMIPWQSQLTPAQMQDLASYIITLEGTNPPNAKEAEGERYERESSVALHD